MTFVINLHDLFYLTLVTLGKFKLFAFLFTETARKSDLLTQIRSIQDEGRSEAKIASTRVPTSIKIRAKIGNMNHIDQVAVSFRLFGSDRSTQLIFLHLAPVQVLVLLQVELFQVAFLVRK